MRVLLQRVSRAEVRVGNRVTGRIGMGLLLFVGFTHTDGDAQLAWMADKVIGLRAFGGRPSFIDAARHEHAIPLYERFIALLRERGARIETGEFGAMMDVELVNDGPVTLWLER